MTLLRVLVLCCALTKVQSVCTSGFSVKCDLLDDVARHEGSSSWENVIVGSLENPPNESMSFAFFKKFPNLQELTIVSRIDELEVGAFGGLEDLLVLTLRNNYIPTLSFGEFIPLTRLVRSDFQNNQIRRIADADLSTSPFLVGINLSHNKLRKIDTKTFTRSSTKRILITHNFISEFGQPPIFSDNLNYLNLDNNELAYVPDGILNLPNLEELILSNNRFNKLNVILPLPSLQKLDLSHNRIDVVAERVFKGMPKLTHVNLNDNEIERLPVHIFDMYSKNNTRLSGLYLRNNKLRNLHFMADKAPVSEISIAQNPLTCMCFDQLLLLFALRGVTLTLCDQKYFFENGNMPICIVGHSDWDEGRCTSSESTDDSRKDFFAANKPYTC